MADSIEQVVYEYLNADAVYLAKFTGIYHLEAPDTATAPYLNYWLVDDPGIDNVLGHVQQGEARIQFDIWDSSLVRGIRLRRDTAVKIRAMSETRSGYHVMSTGVSENTIPRASGTDPFHFVVDGIIRWRKE